MVALAVDRLIAVYAPLKFRTWNGRRQITLMLTIVWIGSLVLACLPAFRFVLAAEAIPTAFFLLTAHIGMFIRLRRSSKTITQDKQLKMCNNLKKEFNVSLNAVLSQTRATSDSPQ